MSDNVLPFEPALKRRRASECKHDLADVDDDCASLTCRDCGAELDPWWFLRKLAHDAEERYLGDQSQMAAHRVWLDDANALASKLKAEIEELYSVKNRLANESTIVGSTLGTVAARLRRGRRKV